MHSWIRKGNSDDTIHRLKCFSRAINNITGQNRERLSERSVAFFLYFASQRQAVEFSCQLASSWCVIIQVTIFSPWIPFVLLLDETDKKLCIKPKQMRNKSIILLPLGDISSASLTERVLTWSLLDSTFFFMLNFSYNFDWTLSKS